MTPRGMKAVAFSWRMNPHGGEGDACIQPLPARFPRGDGSASRLSFGTNVSSPSVSSCSIVNASQRLCLAEHAQFESPVILNAAGASFEGLSPHLLRRRTPTPRTPQCAWAVRTSNVEGVTEPTYSGALRHIQGDAIAWDGPCSG